ncbi:transcriptional repressor TCF25-domain-containing protein [Fusarium venenatum]|uniref:transcriptional repressor TCF25-domain-containing protein n=1 Tax=Fusarium venenatum TaxID=56646 RepID=UPI001D9C49ED|nr:transcriptional repressor TCF25-domain-containing protein [Fusarium venenatum]
MSSRQLRKLQKQRELEEVSNTVEKDSEESEDDQLPVAPKPRVSLFAALGGDDEDDAQDEEEEEQQPEEEVSEIKQPVATGKSKKNKKKKKKAAKAKTPLPEDDEDEIDKAIKELNLTTSKSADPSAADDPEVQTRRINELLSINPYHLKVANEMKNLFGSDIIQSAEAEEEQERNRRFRGNAPREVDIETFLRGPPGQPKLPEISLRRNVFIQGREHWPKQSAGGLTMKEIKKANDGSWTEYAYLHDKNYDATQAFFFTCVQIGDPMRMVHLLKEFPYHVSTLLQVSSVAKQDQNMALAAELCERALFTFGRVTTNAFRQNIEHGKARLDFCRPENRQLWLAGYHYLKSLIRKGTYRTALEWAKLLYSLDHKDPYGMRHFIHLLAIRARESRWLVDFVNELEKTSDNRDTIYLRQSLVLAHLQLGDIAQATEELEKGMRRVPWLYCGLFQELNLDTPPSIWGISADSNPRSFWIKLYIHQAKDLWNNAQATSLLEKVAKNLEKVDTSVLPADDSPPDQGVTRLTFLEGQTSLIALAPREYLDVQPNYEFDPLPPPEEENIFSGHGTRLPWEDRQRGGAQRPVNEIEERLRNIFARRAAAAAPANGAGEGEVDSDDEAALLAQLDDEELERDLAAARNGSDGGVLGVLMQLLGVQTGPTGERADEADADQDQDRETGAGAGAGSGSGTDGGVPGAWPEDH